MLRLLHTIGALTDEVAAEHRQAADGGDQHGGQDTTTPDDPEQAAG
jgi:hypothetical protein